MFLPLEGTISLMEWIPKFFFVMVVGMFCIFFIQDFSYQSFIKEDVEYATKNAAKTAMRKSINKGDLRVSGEVTINASRFQSFYETHYNNNQSVRNSNQTTVIHANSETPPLIALETTGTTNSFFMRAFSATKAGSMMTTTKKEILIIEKK